MIVATKKNMYLFYAQCLCYVYIGCFKIKVRTDHEFWCELCLSWELGWKFKGSKFFTLSVLVEQIRWWRRLGRAKLFIIWCPFELSFPFFFFSFPSSSFPSCHPTISFLYMKPYSYPIIWIKPSFWLFASINCISNLITSVQVECLPFYVRC